MKERSDERRKNDMEKGLEWPPKDSTVRNWKAHGLDCAVARGMSLCGYVRVPEGHPAERKHYDDVEVDVHGGLTFRCKAKEGGSWFGFDTGHAGDWIGLSGVEMPGRIWTEGDVAAETERLAEQLAKRISRSLVDAQDETEER
jgi:hypothetical protein